MNTSPNPLARMNDVSSSLNFMPEQMSRLNTLTQQMQARYRDSYSNLSTLAPAERFARTQALNQQYYNDWSKAAGNVLTDSQQNRYQQLNYQYGGFNSLYDPAVQKQLNLTPAQITGLRSQADWSNQQLQDVYRLGATDPLRGTQAYRDYWTQRQERLKQFLTPDQQKQWLQMTGTPYAFQPEFTPPSQ
ncbi:hypothetical protein [Zavarzinella formosa]|uniref:hypothetical protein n=1 Tax=Zavarzinella formosa TaxID=360055 RepID=UPI0002E4F14B|nr:hypothetical protein [Zavarzinella formosa]